MFFIGPNPENRLVTQTDKREKVARMDIYHRFPTHKDVTSKRYDEAVCTHHLPDDERYARIGTSRRHRPSRDGRLSPRRQRQCTLDDAKLAPSGAYEIVRLQTHEGYAYLKPQPSAAQDSADRAR